MAGFKKTLHSKTFRLIVMLGLTTVFFLVEIVVGYITNSLALIGDSYHMLSDIVALIVGCASVRISKWETHKNTFGWVRAEVLGALVNAVFLIALCFTIFVEAVQRLFHDEHVHDPNLLLIVGSLGLVVNLIGLALFHQHGHSHGVGVAHGHSHGGGASFGNSESSESSYHTRSPDPALPMIKLTSALNLDAKVYKDDLEDEDKGEEEEDFTDIDLPQNTATKKMKKKKPIESSAQLNMRGVFLHVMGDALGSVVVIISALMIKFIDADWKYKVDPAMSMALVFIILLTTIPLLKASALILLQTVPTHIQVEQLQDKLIKKVEGVLAVHEFHIWQLAGNRIIASAHIRCKNLRDYNRIAEEVKDFFHNEGIHSTTIQPEFVELESMLPGQDCMLECGPDKTCYTDTCCPSKARGGGGGETSGVLRQRTSCSGSGGPPSCQAPCAAHMEEGAVVAAASMATVTS